MGNEETLEAFQEQVRTKVFETAPQIFTTKMNRVFFGIRFAADRDREAFNDYASANNIQIIRRRSYSPPSTSRAYHYNSYEIQSSDRRVLNKARVKYADDTELINLT